MNAPDRPVTATKPEPPATSVLVDWYSEGEIKTVEVDSVRVVVRYVGRKGRKARIAIEAPAGAVFRTI